MNSNHKTEVLNLNKSVRILNPSRVYALFIRSKTPNNYVGLPDDEVWAFVGKDKLETRQSFMSFLNEKFWSLDNIDVMSEGVFEDVNEVDKYALLLQGAKTGTIFMR
jgi:hypothetical protein